MGQEEVNLIMYRRLLALVSLLLASLVDSTVAFGGISSLRGVGQPYRWSTGDSSFCGASWQLESSKLVGSDVKVATDTAARRSIRVRTTISSDLPIVAKMLSTATMSAQQSEPAHKNGWGLGTWRARLDQQMAQTDIEFLLRTRMQAMEEGQKAYRRLEPHFAKLTDQERLKLLWATGDRLRNEIAKASAGTGEDNVWRRHNFALTPDNASWFHHIQMTAEDVASQQVVGFCEVAMLSNPLLAERADSEDEDEDSVGVAFSPAITNLATAKEWRRKGIATRMLGLAERIVQRKWKSPHLGLYVEKANQPAMALYESMGFETTVTCDNRGDDRLGDLWYMTKPLAVQKDVTTTTERMLALV